MKKIAVTIDERLDNSVVVTNRVCSICKAKFYFDGWFRNRGRAQSQVDNNCCDSCQFWVDNFWADLIDNSGVVIKGVHYRLSSKNSGFNFGGQIFRIHYFGEQKTHDVYLSHQGTIPREMLPYFPDNAEFREIK